MKQKILLKTMLLLCALVAGTSMSWAQTSTITIDFEDNQIPTGWTNTNDMAVVSNPVTSAANGSYCLSTNGKASNSLTSGHIENIVSISIDAVRTTNNTTNEVYIDFCPNTSFGISDTQSQSVTVEKNSWATSTLTLSSTASGYVRIRRSGGSSTATKFIDNIVITCSSGGGSGTPIPTHTATFSVNGAITSQVFEEGAAITFPSDPAAIGGNTFVGWYTSTYSNASVAPDFVNTATETMGDEDVTYYAVFATASVGDTPTSLTITPSTANFPTSYGSANTFTEYTLEGKKFKIQQGYITGGKMQWRAAGNSNGTGTIYNNEALTKITSVVLTYNSSDTNQNFTLKIGNTANPTSGTSITPTNSSLVYTYDCSAHEYDYFVLTNGSGAGYLDEITINYTSIGTVYSDYCTTVVPPSVATPVISVTSPFTFSTAVTMSCETVGATIYYTLDGTDPTAGSTEYTASFDINATTTIKAIAIKDANASSVATVTATKNLAEPTVTINAAGITNTDVHTGTAAGSLSASVTYNEAPVGGATVTWSSSDEDVATIAADGTVTLVGAGSVTFTATYAGNGDYSEKTATYELTVTSSAPYVQPTTVTFNITQAMFEGVTFNASYQTTKTSISTTVDNVNMTIDKDKGTANIYVKDGEFRCYSGNSLTFESPSGFALTQIVFTKGSNWAMNSADFGSLSSQTWETTTNGITSVTFDFTGRTDITKVVVTLAPIVTVTSAGFATYCSPYALDFSSTAIEAYVGTIVGKKLTFTPIYEVPANTGLLLVASGETNEDIPVIASADPVASCLTGVNEATTLTANDYILNVVDGKAGFYKAGSYTALAAHRAYIPAAVGGEVKAFVFDFDDATGINAIDNGELTIDNAPIYNLAGQRLNKMQKGINIVNGKKILY